MQRARIRGIGLLAAIVVVAGIVRIGTLGEHEPRSVGTVSDDGIYCLEQVNEDGFGNFHNRYAWSMAVFGDHLYVGTYNTIVGEQRGLPLIDAAEPCCGLAGEAARDTVSDGAELWRWDGSTWELAADPAFGCEGNEGVRSLVVHDGELWAGTCSTSTGCEIWRSPDGTSWAPVALGGFDDEKNVSVRGMASWNGDLYVGTEHKTEGADVWRYDGTGWSLVGEDGISNPNNLVVMELQEHDGALFAGTYNGQDGCEVLRYDGTGWEVLVGAGAPMPGGFGDSGNLSVLSMQEFQGGFYVGTANLGGFALWRTADGGATWEEVGDGGLGDTTAKYAWRMAVHDDQLYLATFHTGLTAEPFRIGASLLRSDDGAGWERVIGRNGELAPPGIGDDLNYGFRTLAEFQGELYIGTAQCFFCADLPITGAEVWRLVDGCEPPGGGGCLRALADGVPGSAANDAG